VIGPFRIRSALVGVLAVATASAGALEAQSVRVIGSTMIRYMDVRPFVVDSLPVGETQGTGLLRQTPDGQVVRCVGAETFCRGVRPGSRISTIPAVQDLEVSAWGFGEGIRAFAHLRGRTAWGGNPEFWPRANETLDVMAAYAELDRERYRVRAGRQWVTSGLGFYNFDGVAGTVRPLPGLAVEAQVGRSLVRGLNEQRTGSALEAVEELAPIEPGLLLSAQVRYRPHSRLAVSGLYHRDIRDDRAGIYSELARAEAVFRHGATTVEAALERDLAGGEFNELRLRVRAPPYRSALVAGEVRRYRPYFELWTIWGAFSPVGFDEGRMDVTWARGRGDIIIRGEASYRSYDDTGMATGVQEHRTDGWGLGLNASYSPRSLWRMEGGYRMEVGFGAARSEGHAGVLRQIPDRGHVALRGLAFQRLYEFRLDHGVVLGLGAETALRITDRSRVVGNLTTYRHRDRGDASDMDWTQLRGSLRLQWTVGAEPGTPRPAGGMP
jgi:hypothetical protein